PEFIASFVAIISLGAIAVPINLALRREEQLFILKDCGARAAIIEASTMPDLIGEADAPPELRDTLIVGRGGDSNVPPVARMNTLDFYNGERRLLDASPVRKTANEALSVDHATRAARAGTPAGRRTAPHADAAVDSDSF